MAIVIERGRIELEEKTNEEGQNKPRPAVYVLFCLEERTRENDGEKQVRSEEENGQNTHWKKRGGRMKARRGKEPSQIWLAVAFHRSGMRAYLSSGENRRRSTVVDCSRRWWGRCAEERQEEVS